MGNDRLNTTEANADLQDRVRQFMTMRLPGQPMMMHMGTSYLVHDLAAEVLRLRAEARETALQYLSDTGQMSERIDELVAANGALAADNARLGKRVEDARGLISEAIGWNWIDFNDLRNEVNGDILAQKTLPYLCNVDAKISAWLAGGDA